MRERSIFHTTTTAEFRQLVETARPSGRLNELIQALTERLGRYQAALLTHQTARDFQQIQETKKIIANLESKLQIARQVQPSDNRSAGERANSG